MAKAKQAAAPKPEGGAIKVVGEPGKSQERTLAEVMLDPVASGAATVQRFAKPTFGDHGIGDIFEALRDTVAEVRRGDLGSAETMLVAQAAALNAMFVELARRSQLNMGEYLDASERYMRLALKAQSQCRATLETLAAIKNPPVVYARQANIAHGPQQVNNHGEPAGASPAGEPANQPNGLLEAAHGTGERLDTGTARAAGGGDQEMAAVAAGNGPTHG